jgi:hypothetical protein
MLLAAICGVTILSGQSHGATPTTRPATRPAELDRDFQTTATETTRRLHDCVEILRQRPLLDENALAEQLRPALHKLDASIGSTRSSNFGASRSFEAEACFLDFTAEMMHFGAAMNRIRAVKPAQADRIVALIRTDAPLFKGAAEGMLRSAMRDVASDRKNAAISILQTLRSQIELYKLQHRDMAPDLGSGWDQFLYHTDAAGNVDAKAPYGPYVQRAPVNPLTGGSKTKVLELQKSRQINHDGYKGCDFVFDRAGGQFYMVDADGRLFDE